VKGRHASGYLFPGRGGAEPHMSTRQYARLLDRWLQQIGLDPSLYGTHSLRRTKATLIYKRTGNLRAVQLLLGHTKIESTVRLSWHRGERCPRDRRADRRLRRRGGADTLCLAMAPITSPHSPQPCRRMSHRGSPVFLGRFSPISECARTSWQKIGGESPPRGKA
jgi:hypothetical protein